jgi:allantoate deiminase
VAGTFDPAALDLVDAGGTRLADALRAFGGDPGRPGRRAPRARPAGLRRGPTSSRGPVLEELGAPVGVVSAIAGATRAEVTFTGRAGTPGRCRWALRRDALAAAAAWVLEVEAAGARATAWWPPSAASTPIPGAVNVVAGGAGAARRPPSPTTRPAPRRWARCAPGREAIAAARGVTAGWRELLDAPAVAMDPALTARLRAAAGTTAPVLASGAGHDAVALAALCPVAMLFVRCAGGISHHPDESVREEDAGRAVEVLGAFLHGLAADHGAGAGAAA